MSSGVEASAKKALRDSAWRRFLRGKKRWETKHVSFLAGPRTTEESRKCIGKREGERKNRYYTKFCLLLPYLYSYIWWPFILSEKMIIYFFPFSFMAWSTSAFFGVQDLQAMSPLDASKGFDGENGRMVQSFMTKSQQKRLQDSEGVLISRLKVLIYTLKRPKLCNHRFS